MAAAQRLRASDKQSICRKIVTVLKKRYKGSPPKAARPALETILYAACLEDASPAEANDRFERLASEFHDLNEVRVSSISELSTVFHGLPDPERRALRIRSTLQYVFEKHFDFDFEVIRRKTFESAERQLAKIKGLSPFVRAYTLQVALGSHVIPVDQAMCNAAIWLGLVEPDATPASASDALRSVLRKADAPLFCHLLRRLATDRNFQKTFASAADKPPKEGFDVETAPERLTELFTKTAAAKKRRTAKKRPAARKKKKKTTSRKRSPASKNGRRTARRKTAKRKKAGRRTSTGLGRRKATRKK